MTTHKQKVDVTILY